MNPNPVFALTCREHKRFFQQYSAFRAHMRAEHNISHFSSRDLCEYELYPGSRYNATDYGNTSGPRQVKSRTPSVASSTASAGIMITREELQEHLASCLNAGMRAAADQTRSTDQGFCENVAFNMERSVARMSTLMIRKRLSEIMEEQRLVKETQVYCRAKFK